LDDFVAQGSKMVEQKRSIRRPTDYRRDGVWATKVEFYLLWFEYLALSPSYHLAHLERTNRLPKSRRADLPKDFERVLEVYDDFGDVQRVLFHTWWRERGMELCGHSGDQPKVTRVAALGRKIQNFEKVTNGIENYCAEDWVDQGRQNTLLVAIPIGMPKSRITKQLSAMLERYPDSKKYVRPAPPKYSLVGKRQNAKMLFRYMEVMFVRSLMPEIELWRVGVRSRVSETYSPELEVDADVVRHNNTYDRMILTILTSRAILRSRMISENAARGLFPTYKKCEHAIENDLAALKKRWVTRPHWQKQQNAQTD
jgi:hypothetical protein